MNREQIIRMAREAGAGIGSLGRWLVTQEELERFFQAAYAAGAAAAIKDAPDYKMGYADGVAAEREACAKVCDSNVHDTYIEGYTGAKHSARRECAAAIRARGQA